MLTWRLTTSTSTTGFTPKKHPPVALGHEEGLYAQWPDAFPWLCSMTWAEWPAKSQPEAVVLLHDSLVPT